MKLLISMRGKLCQALLMECIEMYYGNMSSVLLQLGQAQENIQRAIIGVNS